MSCFVKFGRQWYFRGRPATDLTAGTSWSYNICHTMNNQMELDGLPSAVMPPPAVTLTFDLSARKPNKDVSRLRYVCDLILVKLAPIVTKTLYSPSCSGHCLLWSWPLAFWPRNLLSTSTNPNTPVTKIRWTLIYEIWCSQGFRDSDSDKSHRLTLWRTHPKKTECLLHRRLSVLEA